MLKLLKQRGVPYDGFDLYNDVTGELVAACSVSLQTVYGWFHENGFPGNWLGPDSD